MNEPNKRLVRRFSDFIDRPLTVLVILLAFIIYSAWVVTDFQKANQQLIRDTKTSAENSEVIIKKIEQSTEDIKADNLRNTEYLNCLLEAHDIGQFEISDCKHDADKQAIQDHAAHQPQSSSKPSSNSTTKINPTPSPNDPPSSPDEPSVIDRVGDVLNGAVDAVNPFD